MSLVQNPASKRNLVIYFQVHQPSRLRKLRFFDIGTNKGYFDDDLNSDLVQRVARNCYLPTNALLLNLIKKHPELRVAFSISGTALDQFESYAPEVIDSFRDLAATGHVDFLAETYYHSLASLIPGNEFELQVARHQKKIFRNFGVHSKICRNTELIYSNDTGERIHNLGFSGVMIDGSEQVLQGQTPHQLFQHGRLPGLKLLARNYRLSDDIAFRFSQNHSPLTVQQYMNWLSAIPAQERTITLAMDYETFGEHQKRETGIFTFLQSLLTSLALSGNYRFLTPSEAVDCIPPGSALSVPRFSSWADTEKDLSAWLGNEMQRDAFDSMLKLEADVKNLLDKGLLQDWRHLQTSDHFYYMSTKQGSDGDVHNYFSPYPSPYEAFINYMNIITDLSLRVKSLRATRVNMPVHAAVELQPESEDRALEGEMLV